MTKFGIGQPVPRTEDPRLLTGRGRYTGDLTLAGQAFAVMVRSPYAHADIRGIDTGTARAVPGVLAVYTHADLEAAGVGPVPCQFTVPGTVTRPRPALAGGRVRHVGDAVAFVVAETPEAARDAAERVQVGYDERSAVVDPMAALADGADNLCFTYEKGDATAVDAAFASASRTVTVNLVNNRVVATPMEGRAALGDVDPGSGKLTLYVSSQGVHDLRRQLARKVFMVPEDRIRVVTPDVGGGFGMKLFLYPEYILVLFAASSLGRPVKWVSERIEAFLSDVHGRDHVTRAELALDGQGRFLGLRVATVANMGAYLSNYGPFPPTLSYTAMLTGAYAIPALYARVQGVFTNTNPVDAYRGAGRPEAAYVIERLADAAARETGIDPAELRRRNFIPPQAMPHTTPGGHCYDVGDFARVLDEAVTAADIAGFPARRAEAAERGRRRGLGLAYYVEAAAGGAAEQATIRVDGQGRVTVLIGTQSNGQGHETAYKQIVADRLGLSLDDIEVVQGDSERIAYGGGTGGSRSIPVGGAAVAEGLSLVLTKARYKAAELLEAAAVDVEFAEGVFTIVGTDRWIGWHAVAAGAAPADGGAAFDETARWAPPGQVATFPNGAHIAEVEVDPDTGTVHVDRYTVVDDFGIVLNPLLAAGQVHGGIAQGLGQALMERCVYDPETGQLLTGSLTDYALPRAVEVPFIDLRFSGTPSATNMLGMKGAGEAGAIGAPPTLINAIVSALSDYGVTHIDMPATPETVWRSIRAAKGNRP
ncbi:MAG TPA: xanthine dehydrogenase family protein molybdopterin-binding subunit [Azospirillaceae bacterium]|nr:xanthine dehydrogenase family protein molybdopterin-binding subunit [Azospirillaceae bacterium]